MTDDNDGKLPYEVGRGKPPQHTQFVKGKSGNPKGRPKGSRNFATVIQNELKRRIAVNEDGKRKKITKREAVAKQLVNKAAAGDPKILPVLLNEARPYEAAAASSMQSDTMSEDDRMVMDGILRRLRESDAAANSTVVPELSAKSDSTGNDKQNPS